MLQVEDRCRLLGWEFILKNEISVGNCRMLVLNYLDIPKKMINDLDFLNDESSGFSRLDCLDIPGVTSSSMI